MRSKLWLLKAAQAVGVSSIIGATEWRRSRLLILCYHGFSTHDEHEWNPNLYSTGAFLRKRLETLRRLNCRLLPLAEGLLRLREGTLPPMAVALTFDDGARDFADVAVPILTEFDAPATVYVATFYCVHRMPVFDTALSYVLWRGHVAHPRLSASAFGLDPAIDSELTNSTPEERKRAVAAIGAEARRAGLDAYEKNALLRHVAEAVGVDFDEFLGSGRLQLMTAEQLKQLPTPLIDIQLHTHRHRTPRVEALFAREIEDNREALQRLTGSSQPRCHFCYPSGNYAGEFLEWLPKLGVTSATTCIPGLSSQVTDPLLLPRFVDTLQTPDIIFTSWLTGVADLVPRSRAVRLDRRKLIALNAASPGAVGDRP